MSFAPFVAFWLAAVTIYWFRFDLVTGDGVAEPAGIVAAVDGCHTNCPWRPTVEILTFGRIPELVHRSRHLSGYWITVFHPRQSFVDTRRAAGKSLWKFVAIFNEFSSGPGHFNQRKRSFNDLHNLFIGYRSIALWMLYNFAFEYVVIGWSVRP